MNRVIKDELDRIRVASADRLLHKQAVIEAARDEASPLHDRFTWDAQRALDKNLMREAGDLIREYTVVITTRDDRPISTRHLVSLSSDRNAGGGYRVVTEVLSDAALAQQFVDDAIADLAAARAKYGRIKDLEAVFVAIDEAQERHQKTRRAEQRAA